MKKHLLVILFCLATLAPQCLADSNSGYSWDQQLEPWGLAAYTTGSSIQLTWKAPTAFAMTTDNGYVVLAQKDAPIHSDDVFLTNSKLLKAAVFEPLGTTQHTFVDLAAGTYYFKVGVGLCQSQGDKPCQWLDMGYFSTQDISAQVSSLATETKSDSSSGVSIETTATILGKPDLMIKAAKATVVTKKINGAAKKQYKIGVTISNKGKRDAVGDVLYSYNGNPPILGSKGGLKAGMNKKVYVYVDMTEKGKSYVFTVDPANMVEESNEANNTTTRIVGK
jgi:hypothetical protein